MNLTHKALRNKIKSMDFGIHDVSKTIRVNRRVVYLKDVLELLDQQEKEILAKVEKDQKKMGADIAYYMDIREVLG